MSNLAAEAQQMQDSIKKMAEDFVNIQVGIMILESINKEDVNDGA